MPRRLTGLDVWDAAVDRLFALYEDGHRIVVSFSGGKDSTVTLAVAQEAARRAGAGAVDVVMRDEEILFPGTFEYCERVAAMSDVNFHWVYACQPIINVFNREQPYFWTFDPDLAPEEWVRQPPAIAYRIPELHIGGLNTPERFPPAPGKTLISVIGLRASESRVRTMTIHSAGGHMTKPNPIGVRHSRPIYDWTDADVWKTIRDLNLDYAPAYNVMLRMGIPRSRMRIAPPTLNIWGVNQLAMAAAAWPQWFERVARRLPGVRSAANYGMRAVTPTRAAGETWQENFERECIRDAPAWIRERAVIVRDRLLKEHAGHATTPLPEVRPCPHCSGGIGAWKSLAVNMWGGDPFSLRFKYYLKWIDPEYFRPGAGTWGGNPSW